MTPAPASSVLVLVHPGSACGSANMNLGTADADFIRDDLTYLCQEWQGPVVVIDGDFSDELPAYPRLNQALLELLTRAQTQGHLAIRVYGDDNAELDQHVAMANVVAEQGWQPQQVEFSVSGAWFEVDTQGGCVGGIIDALRDQGFVAYVNARVAAVTSDFDLADEEELLALTRPDPVQASVAATQRPRF